MVPQLVYSLLALVALYLVPGAAALDFGNSQWIWTNEVSGGAAPLGARAFRKDFTPPLGKTPVQADILMTVDNGLTLYVNGGEVGPAETSDSPNVSVYLCGPVSTCSPSQASTQGVPLGCWPLSKSPTAMVQPVLLSLIPPGVTHLGADWLRAAVLRRQQLACCHC
ncbi:hypothetical protein B0H13DRAFT_1189441 [Mycena leptocephala]|nr:hypothetical protein B0H13DRAFT_1189441 [Mycena leptocephala]